MTLGNPDIYKMIAEKMLQGNVGHWENEVAKSRIEKKRTYDAEKLVRGRPGLEDSQL